MRDSKGRFTSGGIKKILMSEVGLEYVGWQDVKLIVLKLGKLVDSHNDLVKRVEKLEQWRYCDEEFNKDWNKLGSTVSYTIPDKKEDNEYCHNCMVGTGIRNVAPENCACSCHKKEEPDPNYDKPMNECICNDYDGKGVSCCGFPCPIHGKKEEPEEEDLPEIPDIDIKLMDTYFTQGYCAGLKFTRKEMKAKILKEIEKWWEEMETVEDDFNHKKYFDLIECIKKI